MKLIEGKECDTLLNIAHAIIRQKDTIIASQDRTIIKQDIRQIDTEHLVDECNIQKEAIKNDLKKVRRSLNWTKIGWAATAVLESVLVVYFMIK
jgi:hypothetical protein